MLELAASRTTYHFGNDRKNMRAGTTRRCLLTLVRSTNAQRSRRCRLDHAGHRVDPPDEGDNSRGKWRIEHGRLLETWRFSGESSDSTSVDEIIDLTEKIFKSRIISQEGPGRPEGQVLPSEIFTVTRVTTKK